MLKNIQTFIYDFVIFHLRLLKSNLTVTVLPMQVHYYSLNGWNLTIDPLFILNSFLYIIVFDLGNQYVGKEEDRINKPHRPLISLPNNLISKNIEIYMLCINLFYLSLSWYLGLFHLNVWWVVLCILHNLLQWAQSTLFKNLAMGLGNIILLAGAYERVGCSDDSYYSWLAVLSVVIIVYTSIQDYRDIEGDLLVGRETFPILYDQDGSFWRKFYASFIWAILLNYYYKKNIVLLGLEVVVWLCSFTMFHMKKYNRSYYFYVYWYVVAAIYPLNSC